MRALKSWSQAAALGLFLAAVGVWLPFGHLYLLNAAFLTLPLPVHLTRLALLGGVVVVAATLLPRVVPRRARDAVRAGLLAVGVYAWAQTTLLVGDFGFFDGGLPDWDANRPLLFLEIALAVLLVVTVVRARGFLLRRAGAIMLVLTISAAANLYGPWRAETSRTRVDTRHTFTRTGVFELSPERNVLIFVLDTYQADVFADIVADDPGWRDVFDGFTYFPDATSAYPKTHASIPNLLTGTAFDNSRPFPDYLRDAYLGRSVPRLLKRNGFDVRFHSVVWAPYLAHPDVADNLAGLDSREEIRWLRDRELAQMSNLLAFRLAPFALKMWVFNDGRFRLRTPPAPARADQPVLTDALRRHSSGNDHEDLEFLDEFLAFAAAGSDRPVGRIYHLAGPHAPFRIDAAMNYVGPREYAPGPFRDQSVGALRLMEKVFARLREVGAYDNSLIVVVGDHGNGQLPDLDIATDAWARLDGGPVADPCDDPALLEVMRGGLPLVLAKPPEARGPLRVSSAPVELGDVAATVARVLGLAGAAGVPGRALFEPGFDPRRARLHRHYEFAGWGQDYIVPMTEWTVDGFGWDPRSWSRSGRSMNRNAVASARGTMALLGPGGNLDDFGHAGWSAPEGDGRIIADEEATLVFPVPDEAGSAALQIVLRQVTAEIPPRFRIFLDDAEVAVAEAAGFAPGRRRVFLPGGALTRGDSVKVRFVPEPGDHRGLRFVEVRLDPDTVPAVWPLGAEVSFAEDGAGDRYLDHGWGVPESWGVWTRGSAGSLSLVLDRAPRGDLRVRAELSGAIFEGAPPVRARLMVGGATVADLEAAAPEPAEHVFRIPAGLVPAGGRLDLVIEVENPRSPRQYDVNDDPRLLGIGLWKMSLDEAESPARN